MPICGGMAGHGFGIEHPWRVTGQSRHALPIEPIAGHIAIEQMALHPLRGHPPIDFAHMHDVTGQPQTRLVVQVTTAVQHAHRQVDGGNPGGGVAHVQRQFGFEVALLQGARVQGLLAQAFAQMDIQVLRIFTPAQLMDQAVLHTNAKPRHHGPRHIWHAQVTMGDVRRELRHRTVQRLARARVVVHLHRRHAGMCSFQGGGEFRVYQHGAKREQIVHAHTGRAVPRTWESRNSNQTTPRPGGGCRPALLTLWAQATAPCDKRRPKARSVRPGLAPRRRRTWRPHQSRFGP